MEGVAAAASVAGILSLVGQSISGLLKLKGFYAGLETAPKTVDKFLKDINSLLEALNGVKLILDEWPDESADVHIASLHVQVEACSKDVFDWLQTARDIRPATEKGGRAWFKRFRIAANKNEVNDIRLEISRHRDALNTSLAVIGRLHDVASTLASTQQMRDFGEKVDSLARISSSSLDLQQQISRDLVISRNASSIDSDEKSRSLASIAGSMSKFEALMPLAQLVPPLKATEDEEQDNNAMPLFQGFDGSLDGSEDSSDSIYSLNKRVAEILGNETSLSTYLRSTGSFRNKETLRFGVHEQHERWSCHICFAYFESILVLNRHIKSAHHRSMFWTCGKLQNEVERAYAFAFDPLVPYKNPSEEGFSAKSIICGFCGKQSFSLTCSKLLLEKHLKRLHQFDTCDRPDRFYSLHQFTEHLEKSHGALRGSWMTIIEEACRTSELFTPIGSLDGDERIDASTPIVGEASASGLDMVEFQETLNRSNLLGNWTGSRDRINRWLLHSLVTDETQAQLHRSQIPGPDLDKAAWLRLVLRYWFIDEAATGVEIAHSLSGGAVGSRTGSSPVSSELSEY